MTTTSAQAQPPPQQQQDRPIPLASLSLEELDTIKRRTEQDIEQLAHSMETLGGVIERFVQARESLTVLKPENKGKSVLVPITSSLYVNATLDEAETVLVDIGAKYFVRKTAAEADDYLKRRIATVQQNIAKLDQVVQQKHRLREGVVVTMQSKMAAQQQPAAAEPETPTQ